MNEIINKIICGSVPETLRRFPSESIDCVVTSPPYWALRDYGVEPQIWDGDENCGHEWETRTYQIGNRAGNKDRNQPFFTQRHNVNEQYKASTPTADFCLKCQAWRGSLGLEPAFNLYIKHLADIFDEIKRVLREDGTCWVNLGDTYFGGGNNRGSSEEKLSEKQFSNRGARGQVQMKWNKDYPNKSLCMIPFRFAIEMVNRGWILRNTIIWHKRNCMPSSIKDRFTVDFEYVFFFVKSKKYWFEQIFEPHLTHKHRTIGGEKYKGIYNRKKEIGLININPQGRNKRCVWDITTKPFKEAHFAVFPETLVEPMIKAGCPEFVCKKCGKAREKIYKGTSNQAFNIRVRDVKRGRIKHADRKASQFEVNNYQEGITHAGDRKRCIGYTDCDCNADFDGGIILDPFCGSGTTLLMAKKLGRNYIGIDINPEYVKMSKRRIERCLADCKIKKGKKP